MHFLLIGTALFLLYRALNGGETTAPRDIVVTRTQIEALAQNFARTWMRPPTTLELKGLVDDYVAEEVFYREAIALGLDRDDTVIRRRLRQKMEFISEDVANSIAPTDTQLQAFLDRHAEQFLQPPTFTFRQVFFSLQRRGPAARGDAERLLAELSAHRVPTTPEASGDPTLLPGSMEAATPQDVANAFGGEFAASLEAVPVGQWTGPVQSGFGLHLVRVGRRDAPRAPTLAEIRPLVQREWEAAERKHGTEALLARLKARYDVRIEGPYGELMKADGPSAPSLAAR